MGTIALADRGEAVNNYEKLSANRGNCHSMAWTVPAGHESEKSGELGFEPRQADPESAVLPLHHSPNAKETASGPAFHFAE